MDTSTYYILNYFFFTGKEREKPQTLTQSYDSKEKVLNFLIKAQSNPYIKIITLTRIIEIKELFDYDCRT